MWRFQSVHGKSETEYLDEVIKRIEIDDELYNQAEALLDGAAKAEPLFAECLRTPQDVLHHAEGSTMRDHLRLGLMGLYAVVEDKVHLIDIEEFCRLKGYESEIDEIEEVLKEHVSFFEAFILCHDVAKWVTLFFTSRKGSRGADQGFQMSRKHYFPHMYDERAKMRDEYLKLFQEYRVKNQGLSDRELQANFFLTYEIEVHYPGHARKIHTPVYESLLDRFCSAHGLASFHHDLLTDLIAHHMEVIRGFRQIRPSRIGTHVHFAESRGWDADDYLDLMQGALLLDTVFGSKRLSAHGYWHDPSPLINCLRSEHDWAPHRRAEKELERETSDKRNRNKVFREVGLDGVAVMDLLGMDPGPNLGQTLRRIHAGILGQGNMPKFGKKIDQEIEKRILAYYKKVFVKGE